MAQSWGTLTVSHVCRSCEKLQLSVNVISFLCCARAVVATVRSTVSSFVFISIRK